MRDIFDIIKEQKNNKLRLKGVVSEYSNLPFTVGDINKIIETLTSSNDKIEIITFNIDSGTGNHRRDPLTVGVYGSAYEWDLEVITFDIDVNMTMELYNSLYGEFEDLIDYFTPGNIKYDYTQEEIVRPIEGVYYNNESRVRINATLDDIVSNWDYEVNTDWGLGSHPVLDGLHDADGDAVFAAEFRPTDMSNMFRNSSIDLSRLD